MSYRPKSTYQIKEASAGEFVYKKSRKPFRGKYVHTSDNKFFAGENTLRLGPELIKPDLDIDNFGQLREVKKYHILQPETYQDLKDNEFLVPSKTIPTLVLNSEGDTSPAIKLLNVSSNNSGFNPKSSKDNL